MSNTFALLYQPPCGQWYVHSHKLYPTPEAADAAAVKFLHPDTPRVVIPITFPATPSQRLDAATVERCAQVAEAFYKEHEPEMGDRKRFDLRDISRFTRTCCLLVAEDIRALATDPHQHGGKGA